MRLDAYLSTLPLPRDEQTKGRPAVKGQRQPPLTQRLIDPKTDTVDW
jgi:hypothetical protein